MNYESSVARYAASNLSWSVLPHLPLSEDIIVKIDVKMINRQCDQCENDQ